MIERTYYRPRWGLFVVMRRLFVVMCVLIAVFSIVGYAWGWIKLDHNESQQKATIEIDTGEIRDSADKAVEKTKDLIEDAGDKLKN